MTLCKKCLLREAQGEEMYQSIMEYVKTIPPEEKASEAEYQRRLEICQKCERLTNGLCALCGCFVEVRAAKARMYCANDLW